MRASDNEQGINKLRPNTKIWISREQNIFSSNKKNNLLHIKGYFTAKYSFAVEVTFKEYFKVQVRKIKSILRLTQKNTEKRV